MTISVIFFESNIIVWILIS